MRSRSLHIDGIKWEISVLGEQAIMLRPKQKETPLAKIHKAVQILEQTEIQDLVDIVPAYESIALIYRRLLEEVDADIREIKHKIQRAKISISSPREFVVPVYYEAGLDWKEVEHSTGLQRVEIINKHLSAEYIVAMTGFIPGFIYLSGMDEEIACPRKETPRTKIPAGSVGIGGNHAGIYSLESPGGWQIIGRTPHSFFDATQNPPIHIRPGDRIRFSRISNKEFEEIRKKVL